MRDARMLPLFPLHTVLFPGGVLPLRIFEQRYVDMTKACLANDTTFGVVLIRSGDEVMRDKERAAPEFAAIGTEARILEWDMPELGILHVRAQALKRFSVSRHSVGANGLLTGDVTALPDEPSRPVAENFAPLVRLLELIATRVGPRQFPPEFYETTAGAVPRRTRLLDDASWVGYRLAEVLPLPLNIKQSMLEINDSEVRLSVLMRFLSDQGLL